MLKYFNYLAFVSFIMVVVVAFFTGVYFRSSAADAVLRRPIVSGNEDLVNKLTQNILCKYYPILKRVDPMPVQEWREDKYFSKLEQIAAAALSINSAEKVTLYNKKREQFFTTNQSETVFFGDEPSDFLNKAQSTGKESVLLPSMGLQTESGALTKGSYIRTVISTDTSSCSGRKPDDPNMGFLVEIYNNVSKPWEQLYIFQIIVSAGIVVTFILLYMALYLTSKKTEKLVNKQHEEKLKLEKAKSIAEAQNQQKSMFLANVSHELRTPLNAIIGFSEIIKDEVMGPVGHPQYKEYVTDINSSGVHLLSLINDILDYSKAEARKLDVEAVDIDLSKIAHSCMRLIEPRAKEAKVSLVENLPEAHVVLAADPKRMKQVILNLLSNAVKFTPEEGTVTLTVNEDLLSGNIILIVADNGIGIAPKDISKAMAPFGQIDSSISRRYEGTGLGLPLTKKLTELMGGKFEIKSEVGLGTTVELTFPLVKEKSQDEVKANF